MQKRTIELLDKLFEKILNVGDWVCIIFACLVAGGMFTSLLFSDLSVDAQAIVAAVMSILAFFALLAWGEHRRSKKKD